MQSFGWKRKAGLTKPKPAVFSQDNVEVDNDMNDPDVDWLTATKKPKVLQLEDAKAKARRLSNEGVMLAESERWWAAIGRWNAALALTPDDYALHEMWEKFSLHSDRQRQLCNYTQTGGLDYKPLVGPS